MIQTDNLYCAFHKTFLLNTMVIAGRWYEVPLRLGNMLHEQWGFDSLANLPYLRKWYHFDIITIFTLGSITILRIIAKCRMKMVSFCYIWCLLLTKICNDTTNSMIGVCNTPMWSTGMFSEIQNLHRLNHNELQLSCLQDVTLRCHIHGDGCLQTPIISD